MALHYGDASAVVKRYVPETGSAWIHRVFVQDQVSFCQQTIAEVASALARRSREGSITQGERDAAFLSFLRDLDDYAVTPVTEELVLEASGLVLSVPTPLTLRAADALHIASAQRVFERLRTERLPAGRFLTADMSLAAAARWAGLPVANPEDYQ